MKKRSVFFSVATILLAILMVITSCKGSGSSKNVIIGLDVDSSSWSGRTGYAVGEPFDPTGIKVYEVYSNGNRIPVDNANINFVLSNGNVATRGYILSESDNEGNLKLHAELYNDPSIISEEINLPTYSEISEIEVSGITKYDYDSKDNVVDLSNLKITVSYESGNGSVSSKTISYASDDNRALKNNGITITKRTGNSEDFTTEITGTTMVLTAPETIHVNYGGEFAKIEFKYTNKGDSNVDDNEDGGALQIETMPKRVIYGADDSFSPAGLLLRLDYTSGGQSDPIDPDILKDGEKITYELPHAIGGSMLLNSSAKPKAAVEQGTESTVVVVTYSRPRNDGKSGNLTLKTKFEISFQESGDVLDSVDLRVLKPGATEGSENIEDYLPMGIQLKKVRSENEQDYTVNDIPSNLYLIASYIDSRSKEHTKYEFYNVQKNTVLGKVKATIERVDLSRADWYKITVNLGSTGRNASYLVQVKVRDVEKIEIADWLAPTYYFCGEFSLPISDEAVKIKVIYDMIDDKTGDNEFDYKTLDPLNDESIKGSALTSINSIKKTTLKDLGVTVNYKGLTAKKDICLIAPPQSVSASGTKLDFPSTLKKDISSLSSLPGNVTLRAFYTTNEQDPVEGTSYTTEYDFSGTSTVPAENGELGTLNDINTVKVKLVLEEEIYHMDENGDLDLSDKYTDATSKADYSFSYRVPDNLYITGIALSSTAKKDFTSDNKVQTYRDYLDNQASPKLPVQVVYRDGSKGDVVDFFDLMDKNSNTEISNDDVPLSPNTNTTYDISLVYAYAPGKRVDGTYTIKVGRPDSGQSQGGGTTPPTTPTTTPTTPTTSKTIELYERENTSNGNPFSDFDYTDYAYVGHVNLPNETITDTEGKKLYTFIKYKDGAKTSGFKDLAKNLFDLTELNGVDINSPNISLNKTFELPIKTTSDGYEATYPYRIRILPEPKAELIRNGAVVNGDGLISGTIGNGEVAYGDTLRLRFTNVSPSGYSNAIEVWYTTDGSEVTKDNHQTLSSASDKNNGILIDSSMTIRAKAVIRNSKEYSINNGNPFTYTVALPSPDIVDNNKFTLVNGELIGEKDSLGTITATITNWNTNYPAGDKTIMVRVATKSDSGASATYNSFSPWSSTGYSENGTDYAEVDQSAGTVTLKIREYDQDIQIKVVSSKFKDSPVIHFENKRRAPRTVTILSPYESEQKFYQGNYTNPVRARVVFDVAGQDIETEKLTYYDVRKGDVKPYTGREFSGAKLSVGKHSIIASYTEGGNTAYSDPFMIEIVALPYLDVTSNSTVTYGEDSAKVKIVTSAGVEIPSDAVTTYSLKYKDGPQVDNLTYNVGSGIILEKNCDITNVKTHLHDNKEVAISDRTNITVQLPKAEGSFTHNTSDASETFTLSNVSSYPYDRHLEYSTDGHQYFSAETPNGTDSQWVKTQGKDSVKFLKANVSHNVYVRVASEGTKESERADASKNLGTRVPLEVRLSDSSQDGKKYFTGAFTWPIVSGIEARFDVDPDHFVPVDNNLGTINARITSGGDISAAGEKEIAYSYTENGNTTGEKTFRIEVVASTLSPTIVSGNTYIYGTSSSNVALLKFNGLPNDASISFKVNYADGTVENYSSSPTGTERQYSLANGLVLLKNCNIVDINAHLGGEGNDASCRSVTNVKVKLPEPGGFTESAANASTKYTLTKTGQYPSDTKFYWSSNDGAKTELTEGSPLSVIIPRTSEKQRIKVWAEATGCENSDIYLSNQNGFVVDERIVNSTGGVVLSQIAKPGSTTDEMWDAIVPNQKFFKGEYTHPEYIDVRFNSTVNDVPEKISTSDSRVSFYQNGSVVSAADINASTGTKTIKVTFTENGHSAETTFTVKIVDLPVANMNSNQGGIVYSDPSAKLVFNGYDKNDEFYKISFNENGNLVSYSGDGYTLTKTCDITGITATLRDGKSKTLPNITNLKVKLATPSGILDKNATNTETNRRNSTKYTYAPPSGFTYPSGSQLKYEINNSGVWIPFTNTFTFDKVRGTETQKIKIVMTSAGCEDSDPYPIEVNPTIPESITIMNTQHDNEQYWLGTYRYPTKEDILLHVQFDNNDYVDNVNPLRITTSDESLYSSVGNGKALSITAFYSEGIADEGVSTNEAQVVDNYHVDILPYPTFDFVTGSADGSYVKYDKVLNKANIRFASPLPSGTSAKFATKLDDESDFVDSDFGLYSEGVGITIENAGTTRVAVRLYNSYSSREVNEKALEYIDIPVVSYIVRRPSSVTINPIPTVNEKYYEGTFDHPEISADGTTPRKLEVTYDTGTSHETKSTINSEANNFNLNGLDVSAVRNNVVVPIIYTENGVTVLSSTFKFDVVAKPVITLPSGMVSTNIETNSSTGYNVKFSGLEGGTIKYTISDGTTTSEWKDYNPSDGINLDSKTVRINAKAKLSGREAIIPEYSYSVKLPALIVDDTGKGVNNEKIFVINNASSYPTGSVFKVTVDNVDKSSLVSDTTAVDGTRTVSVTIPKASHSQSVNIWVENPRYDNSAVYNNTVDSRVEESITFSQDVLDRESGKNFYASSYSFPTLSDYPSGVVMVHYDNGDVEPIPSFSVNNFDSTVDFSTNGEKTVKYSSTGLADITYKINVISQPVLDANRDNTNPFMYLRSGNSVNVTGLSGGYLTYTSSSASSLEATPNATESSPNTSGTIIIKQNTDLTSVKATLNGKWVLLGNNGSATYKVKLNTPTLSGPFSTAAADTSYSTGSEAYYKVTNTLTDYPATGMKINHKLTVNDSPKSPVATDFTQSSIKVTNVEAGQSNEIRVHVSDGTGSQVNYLDSDSEAINTRTPVSIRLKNTSFPDVKDKIFYKGTTFSDSEFVGNGVIEVTYDNGNVADKTTVVSSNASAALIGGKAAAGTYTITLSYSYTEGKTTVNSASNTTTGGVNTYTLKIKDVTPTATRTEFNYTDTGRKVTFTGLESGTVVNYKESINGAAATSKSYTASAATDGIAITKKTKLSNISLTRYSGTSYEKTVNIPGEFEYKVKLNTVPTIVGPYSGASGTTPYSTGTTAYVKVTNSSSYPTGSKFVAEVQQGTGNYNAQSSIALTANNTSVAVVSGAANNIKVKITCDGYEPSEYSNVVSTRLQISSITAANNTNSTADQAIGAATFTINVPQGTPSGYTINYRITYKKADGTAAGGATTTTANLSGSSSGDWGTVTVSGNTVKISKNLFDKSVVFWISKNGYVDSEDYSSLQVGKVTATSLPTGSVSPNSPAGVTDAKKKIYIANAQGYVLEFRLSDETVNSYDTYKNVRDAAKYKNNGWKPLQDWVIDQGNFYTAAYNNFNLERQPASNKDYWCYYNPLTSGVSVSACRKIYGPNGELDLWDQLREKCDDNFGTRIILGTTASGNHMVNFHSTYVDDNAWENVGVLFVRPL